MEDVPHPHIVNLKVAFSGLYFLPISILLHINPLPVGARVPDLQSKLLVVHSTSLSWAKKVDQLLGDIGINLNDKKV